MRELQLAHLVAVGAGEAAAHMAEQFRSSSVSVTPAQFSATKGACD